MHDCLTARCPHTTYPGHTLSTAQSVPRVVSNDYARRLLRSHQRRRPTPTSPCSLTRCCACCSPCSCIRMPTVHLVQAVMLPLCCRPTRYASDQTWDNIIPIDGTRCTHVGDASLCWHGRRHYCPCHCPHTLAASWQPQPARSARQFSVRKQQP